MYEVPRWADIGAADIRNVMLKPFYQDKQIIEYCGHTPGVLKELPAESVHMVVTSVPYWGLRDYGLEPQVWVDRYNIPPLALGCHIGGDSHKWQPSLEPGGQGNGNSFRRDKKAGRKRGGQQPGFCQKCNAWRGSLGLEPTPELYIQHIVQVFREVRRVLRKDGTCWLNIGDSYNSSGGHTQIENDGRANRTARSQMKGANVKNLKPKDLCLIPARVALALQADGWWLRSDIIWAKPNPMPESCTDRPTNSHEHIFLLTESGTSQFWTHRDLSGIREKPKADYRWINQIAEEEMSVAPPDWKEIIICPNCEGKGRALIDLSYECLGIWTEYWTEAECPVCKGKKKAQKWKRINLWKGHDYFYDADAVREEHKPDGRKQTLTTIGPSSHENYTGSAGHERWPNSGRNLRSVWTIATEPTPEAHFATFPSKLCEIAIKAGTSEKGCCPECGGAWVRVVEKAMVKSPKASKPEVNRAAVGDGISDTSTFRTGLLPQSKTTRWSPVCQCSCIPVGTPHNPIPCTVLDPFSGSGKALIVAKKLGRKAIGIDLKLEYLRMPLKKLAQERLI